MSFWISTQYFRSPILNFQSKLFWSFLIIFFGTDKLVISLYTCQQASLHVVLVCTLVDKTNWVIKYDWWPYLQASLHVVLVCTLVHCLHVGITHASAGARQVYDYFHKGFPCIWKPLPSSQWFICRVTSPQPVPIFTSGIGETLWSLQYLSQEQDALL